MGPAVVNDAFLNLLKTAWFHLEHPIWLFTEVPAGLPVEPLGDLCEEAIEGEAAV